MKKKEVAGSVVLCDMCVCSIIYDSIDNPVINEAEEVYVQFVNLISGVALSSVTLLSYLERAMLSLLYSAIYSSGIDIIGQI